jgi:ubiquitin carboxyl-terminal hydrolase 7
LVRIRLFPRLSTQTNISTAAKFAEQRAELERRKKEKEEAHLYMEVTVATEENFTHHQGFDIIPLVPNEMTEEEAKPTTLRIKKKLTISEFVIEFAKDKELDPETLRPWCMVNRQNGTTRPDQPIIDGDMTIEEASSKFGHKNNLRLWMENASGKDKDGKPIFGDTTADIHAKGGKEGEKPMVLFLKYFDVDKQTLYGVGHFYATPSEKVSDLSPQILNLMGWPAGTAYRIYEVRTIHGFAKYQRLTFP